MVDLQYKKPDTVLGYNNYTSPSVGCLVYFHSGMSMVLFLCMMSLPLTVIPRWARVWLLPGGQMQMSLIIRDALEDDDEEIENGL